MRLLLWSFKVIFKVERSIPRSFVCNFDWKIHSGTVLMIKGHLQGQKVNFK